MDCIIFVTTRVSGSKGYSRRHLKGLQKKPFKNVGKYRGGGGGVSSGKKQIIKQTISTSDGNHVSFSEVSIIRLTQKIVLYIALT
jgi:hypothetical protein